MKWTNSYRSFGLKTKRSTGLKTIEHKHRFAELSGGEAQRLMLARAFAAQPSLMLVDEPTAQLDMHTAATVSESLSRIARNDTIVVVSTHDPNTRDACTDIIDLKNYQ